MSIIKPRRGSGSPTGLTANELAIDTTNKRVYVGNAAGTGDIVASHIENYVSSFNGSSGAVTFVNYVSSVNGATGAITNVAKTDVAQTFTATQNFTAGISASGGTFASAIRVDGFVDVGLGGGANSTNLMVGYLSLDANTSGLNNTAVGYNTLGLNQDGTSNLAVGSNALSSNVSGIGNVGLGSASLQYSTSNYNTSVGGNALTGLGFFGLGAGSQNVAVGYDAGKVDPSLNPIWGITGCVMIGYDTRPLANNGTNEIVIGYNGRGNGSNTTTIGSTSTTDAYIHGLLHLSGGLSAADIAVNGGDITSTQTTFNLVNSTVTTLNIAGASGSTINIGATAGTSTIDLNSNLLKEVEFRNYFETKATASTTSVGMATYLLCDLSSSNVFTFSTTSTAISGISVTNIPSKANTSVGFTIVITNGNALSTFNYDVFASGSVKWAGGTPPTFTTTVGNTDIISYVTYDGGTTWYGFVGGLDFS